MIRSLFLAVALLAGAAVQAQPVLPAKSHIDIQFTQMGVPVQARFTRFSGTVDYDPATPAQTRAQLRVDIASFDLGDPAYNAEVQKPDWFDGKQFPQAIFAVDSVQTRAPGQLEAHGTLNIKGHTRDVVVPIAVASSGAQRTFSGTLTISRLDFDVGQGEWRGTDLVAAPVRIRFVIVTGQ